MDLPCALVSWRVLYSLWILSSLLLVGPTRSLLPNPLIDAAEKANSLKKLDECFCQVSIMIIYYFLYHFYFQLSGPVDVCCCDVETVDKLNSEKIYPLISSLVKQPYFRYFKVSTRIMRNM